MLNAGKNSSPDTDKPAAQHDPPVLGHVSHSLEERTTAAINPLGDVATFGQQIDNLCDAKDSQCDGDEGDSVEQVELVEGVAIDRVGRSRADASQQDRGTPRDRLLGGAVPGETKLKERPRTQASTIRESRE